MTRHPDFIIIGAMKCATSTLSAQLAAQSGIFVGNREINFFSDDERYSRGMSWYEGQFQDADQDDICGESSTHYTKLPTYPHAVERMARHLPNIRLIYVMRHPIDRLKSQYVHEWTQRIVDGSIERAIEQYGELTSYSLYSTQLEPFLETFGRERVLPVFFDRLLRSPQEELERICGFLGFGQPVKWRSNTTRNVSSERMRENPVRDAIIELGPLVWLRRRFIPKSVRTRIRQLWTMKEHPELSERRERQLAELFDDDLARLGRWLGADLRCENFRERTASESLNWKS